MSRYTHEYPAQHAQQGHADGAVPFHAVLQSNVALNDRNSQSPSEDGVGYAGYSKSDIELEGVLR